MTFDPRRMLLAVFYVLASTAVADDETADTPPLRRNDSAVPGVVITHQPASSRIYLGSPGIAILPDGSYLAKCDEFGPGSTEHQSAVTRVYRSEDRGLTWKPAATLNHLFWASLFVHDGATYLLGTTRHHGLVTIRRSDDGGRTWTPSSEGLLTPQGEYHTAPGPILRHDGRLWRAIEDASTGRMWGLRYSAQMMCAPLDADLLRPESWTFSNMIRRDSGWLNGDFKAFLEGNAVVHEDRVYNVLRVQRMSGGAELAAVCDVSADGTQLSFDPKGGFVPMPGGAKKFTIRRDPQSGAFWTLATVVAPNITPGRGDGLRPSGGIRNTMALLRSEDLRSWETRCVLLHHPDIEKHAFQYPDFQFEGDAIIAAVRTAYEDGLGGAHRAHDANYLTFHRFEDFRDLQMSDSAVTPTLLGYDSEDAE